MSPSQLALIGALAGRRGGAAGDWHGGGAAGPGAGGGRLSGSGGGLRAQGGGGRSGPRLTLLGGRSGARALRREGVPLRESGTRSRRQSSIFKTAATVLREMWNGDLLKRHLRHRRIFVQMGLFVVCLYRQRLSLSQTSNLAIPSFNGEPYKCPSSVCCIG